MSIVKEVDRKTLYAPKQIWLLKETFFTEAKKLLIDKGRLRRAGLFGKKVEVRHSVISDGLSTEIVLQSKGRSPEGAEEIILDIGGISRLSIEKNKRGNLTATARKHFSDPIKDSAMPLCQACDVLSDHLLVLEQLKS